MLVAVVAGNKRMVWYNPAHHGTVANATQQFLHFMLSHLPSARSLIQSLLSPEAMATLDLATLKLETTSFIDADLRREVLGSALLGQLAASKSMQEAPVDEALIYLLFEHKSQSDSAHGAAGSFLHDSHMGEAHPRGSPPVPESCR